MIRTWPLVLLVIAAITGIPSAAAAQGSQTGTLTGHVASEDGAPVPGARVSVGSPALQGDRAATTDVNGVFSLPALPPGAYTVRITAQGWSPRQLDVVLPLGSTVSADAVLSIAPVAESVEVEGVARPEVTATQTATNITAREINLLPIGRTPFLIAEQMPGVTSNTPNAGQLTISGAFAFDNVFLVDGVDVNDNLLGTMNDLFIEEAVAEVQVLTAGISAEYGRFSGGVINVITRTGSNRFSGSYRTTFSRPSWTDETPFEDARGVVRGEPTDDNRFLNDNLSHFTELTAGGPVLRDRLWFFGAGRFESSSIAGTMPLTAVPYTKTTDGKRYEGKLTATPRAGHTVQGTFVGNEVNRANEPVLSFSIDRAALISPSVPNRLGVLNYTGTWSPNLILTAQYSRKSWATRGVGGTSTDLLDSPFLTRTGTAYQYNAPFFDASDPEERNNAQLTASATYALSHARWGSHEVKGGLERFTDTRVGANAQSSTGYVFMSNIKLDAAGRAVLDVDGHPTPLFVPGTSRVQRWFPRRGAEFDMHTTSAYLQDRWMVSPRVTLNLGVRFEHAASDATGSALSSGVSRTVPRIGAAYDVAGNGRTVVHATVSQYAGKYNVVQFSRNTSVGNSDRYALAYQGPAGEGRSFAPGFDLDNYRGVVGGTFPALNVRFADDLSPPVTTEFTVGAGRMFGARSFGKLVYVHRAVSNVIEEFINTPNDRTPIVIDGATLAFLDTIVYDNTDELTREYRALQLMGEHRLFRDLSVSGHWTVQLRNHGNFEGESPNPTGSPFGDYPEMLSLARSAPTGRLDDFQRSKLRIWADYTAALGRWGSINVAPLFRHNSGRTFSLVLNNQPLSAIQSARNPGYASTPTQQIFFGQRGSQSFPGYGLLDLALTYSIPVWRSAYPWVKFQVFNITNNQKLIAWDTALSPDNASPRDDFGLPTGYLPGAAYGQGTATSHYPAPRPGLDGGRTFDIAIGLRF